MRGGVSLGEVAKQAVLHLHHQIVVRMIVVAGHPPDHLLEGANPVGAELESKCGPQQQAAGATDKHAGNEDLIRRPPEFLVTGLHSQLSLSA